MTLLLPNPRGRFPLACGPDPETLGLRVPGAGRRGVAGACAGRCCSLGATARGGPDARRLEDVPERDPRRRGPRARRRRAAGDAVDGHRPARLRGRGRVAQVVRPGAVAADEVAAASPIASRWHVRTPPRLLRAPARRRRPRGRRGHRPRARAPAAHAGDDRLRELRAPGRPRVPGQRADQQVRRGLPGQALLRRLRARRRHRAARDRPREGAVRRRARQRPAARRRAGQHRRLPRAAAARRHDHGPLAAARRPPHARHEDQRLRPALRHRAVRGRPRDQPDRHGRGRADRPRAPAEADPRRLVGLPALPRLRALPRDRRRRRRAPDGRHGALRRPRRRRPAPEPGAATPTSSRRRSTRRSAAPAAA